MSGIVVYKKFNYKQIIINNLKICKNNKGNIYKPIIVYFIYSLIHSFSYILIFIFIKRYLKYLDF